jgi:hypothetical protein
MAPKIEIKFGSRGLIETAGILTKTNIGSHFL